MTRQELTDLTRKELADIARAHGVAGWHDLKKEHLVVELVKSFRKYARRKGGKPPPVPIIQRSAARDTAADKGAPLGKFLSLATPMPRELAGSGPRDRVVLVVRDPYWLHCTWELTAQALARAQAALGQEWHGSKPHLRLFEMERDNASTAPERIVRDIEIRGGSNNWYIDVTEPPRSFRVDVGYLSRAGRFYSLARSNPVTTPRPGLSATRPADPPPVSLDGLPTPPAAPPVRPPASVPGHPGLSPLGAGPNSTSPPSPSGPLAPLSPLDGPPRK